MSCLAALICTLRLPAVDLSVAAIASGWAGAGYPSRVARSGALVAGSSRYVLPIDQPVVLGRAGFLDVLSAEAWWTPPEARPWPCADLVGCPSSFALLAAGRAGKTRLFRSLRRQEPGAVEVKLSILDKAGMHEELSRAIAAGVPVYLDALDEAELSEPDVFRILEHHMTAPTASGVLWRLAPPAGRSSRLAETLSESLPRFRRLRLLPLTRDGAAELVAEAGAEPGEFIDALLRADLGRLAASPDAAGCRSPPVGDDGRAARQSGQRDPVRGRSAARGGRSRAPAVAGG